MTLPFDIAWLAKKGQKDGITSHYWKVSRGRSIPPAQLESAPTTTGLWNYHKHDKQKKKESEYFTASILRARNVNFTNKLPSRFCSREIGALAFLWFLHRDRKQINSLPLKNELARPIRKHNSSLMEIPEAEKWGGKVWGNIWQSQELSIRIKKNRRRWINTQAR